MCCRKRKVGPGALSRGCVVLDCSRKGKRRVSQWLSMGILNTGTYPLTLAFPASRVVAALQAKAATFCLFGEKGSKPPSAVSAVLQSQNAFFSRAALRIRTRAREHVDRLWASVDIRRLAATGPRGDLRAVGPPRRSTAAQHSTEPRRCVLQLAPTYPQWSPAALSGTESIIRCLAA